MPSRCSWLNSQARANFNTAPALIRGRQHSQRIVQRDRIEVGNCANRQLGVELDVLVVAATLEREARPRGIDQDTPHRLRRDGKKVCPVPPVQLAGVHEPQIRFVNQFASLRRAVAALPAKLTMSQERRRMWNPPCFTQFRTADRAR